VPLRSVLVVATGPAAPGFHSDLDAASSARSCFGSRPTQKPAGNRDRGGPRVSNGQHVFHRSLRKRRWLAFRRDDPTCLFGRWAEMFFFVFLSVRPNRLFRWHEQRCSFSTTLLFFPTNNARPPARRVAPLGGLEHAKAISFGFLLARRKNLRPGTACTARLLCDSAPPSKPSPPVACRHPG